jgi:hypothetical protein
MFADCCFFVRIVGWLGAILKYLKRQDIQYIQKLVAVIFSILHSLHIAGTPA